jgi:tetratricopeptide (TPR) repeat protein
MLSRMLALCLLLATAPGAFLDATPPAAYVESIHSAREALARGDTVSALAMLDHALRIDPEGAEGFALLGQAYRRLGRYAEAQSVLERAVALLGEITPAGQDALCELAAALGDAERNEDAIATLKKVIALAPDRPGAHRDLGMINLVIGRLEAAAAEFRKEIALHPPGARNAVLASAYEGLGIAAYRTGDDDTALDALSRAPDTIEARYNLGLALARRGRNEEAAAAFRDVLRREPDHRGALQGLARAAGALGLEDERGQSLRHFQELYAAQEAGHALRLRVRDLRKQAQDKVTSGDVAGAVAAMEQASKLSPDDVDILLDLGRLLARAGETARSEQAYRGAIQRDPLRAEAHYRIGRILGDRGDLAGAVTSMEKAAGLEPMAVPYHVGLAQLYLRAKRAEDGVRELRLAKRINPADPSGSFNLGLGLAQTGHLPEAAAELESAVKQGYGDPVAHQALAQIYRALGDAERSAKEQQLFESLMRQQGTKP